MKNLTTNHTNNILNSICNFILILSGNFVFYLFNILSIISTHYLAMLKLVAKKFSSAGMLERLAAALEIEPHELFYMPGIAENSLEHLQESIVTNIERVVANTIKETLENKYKI